jgi:hypothetical protein
MQHLFLSPKEEDMIDYYNDKINLWQSVLDSSTLIEKEDCYELCLTFTGKFFEDDIEESREYNDGCAFQFIFDELRCIGMIDLMGIRKELIRQCEAVTFDKNLWVEFEMKSDKYTEYWFSKADNFRMDSIKE